MAVTTTKDIDTVFGHFRVTGGTYSADNTGGDISTGLTEVYHILLTATGSSIVADAPTVNETGTPLGGAGSITIIVTSATAGRWMAFGY